MQLNCRDQSVVLGAFPCACLNDRLDARQHIAQRLASWQNDSAAGRKSHGMTRPYGCPQPMCVAVMQLHISFTFPHLAMRYLLLGQQIGSTEQHAIGGPA